MRNIIIESGHGLTMNFPKIVDNGASVNTPQGYITERSLTEKYGLMTAETLREKEDAQVYLSGVETLATKGRKIKYINSEIKKATQANAYGVSIHVNSGKGQGAECYYQSVGISEKAKRQSINLATQLLTAYCAWTGLKNKGVKPSSSSRFRRLYIDDIKWCPFVLLETGFIDSTDLKTLQDYRKVSDGIATGLYHVTL